MAKPAHGGDGTLVGLSSLPVHGSRTRWPQLAEWVCVSFRAEEEQRLDLAQERERRLGRQTAALNHDLRNHLNLASMQLERLRLEGQSPGDSQTGGSGDGPAKLAELSRSLGNARDLCAGTVVGQGGLEHRRIQLRPRLLAQSRAASELSGSGKDVRILVRCRADIVVRGHPSHLDRLIKNLVLNAIEASLSGGEVRLVARLVEGAVHLEVIDTGRGMDAAGLAQWMRPGQSGRGGTGYGSASLQECLDQLGGEMEVASTPGEGTRIGVRLPAVHASQAALVVLLDPDARRREIRKAALAGRGWSVADACSVEDARTWLGDPALERVFLPRGMRDGGLASFLAAAKREGVDVQLLGVMG
jgi:signal transduction histidine kinase